MYSCGIAVIFSPSSPSPVTQQMTAMSISQDSGAVDSDRAEAEEAEEEGTSNNTGKGNKNTNLTHFIAANT